MELNHILSDYYWHMNCQVGLPTLHTVTDYKAVINFSKHEPSFLISKEEKLSTLDARLVRLCPRRSVQACFYRTCLQLLEILKN